MIDKIGGINPLNNVQNTRRTNDVAKSTFILEGGYKKLSYDEVVNILKESM